MSSEIKLHIFSDQLNEKYVLLVRKDKKTWFLATSNKSFTEINIGQWLTRTKIKVDECSLSPDGKLFAYFAFKFDPYDPQQGSQYETYTAVSIVPYFTAVCFSHSDGTWTGGGGFITNNTYKVFGGKRYLEENCNRRPDVCQMVTGNMKEFGSGLVYSDCKFFVEKTPNRFRNITEDTINDLKEALADEKFRLVKGS